MSFKVKTLGQNELKLTSFALVINTTSSNGLVTSSPITGNFTANSMVNLMFSTASLPGNANVTLTATDDQGFTFDLQTFNVIVNDRPTLGQIDAGKPAPVYNKITRSSPSTWGP